MIEKPNKKESLEKSFKINISYSEIEKHMEENFLELSKTLKIQGFRPGKIPVSFVKKKYFSEVLKKISEKLIQQEGNKTILDKGYKLAGQPKVTLLSEIKENVDLSAEFVFDIIPDFKLKDFKDKKLERYTTTVEKKDVDKVIKKLFHDYRTFTKIKLSRVSKKGDKLLINFKGFIDGEVFEGGTAENQTIELGNNNYLPEFDKNLINKKEGDNFFLELKFPSNYHNPKLKDKNAKFDINIKEIQEPILLKNEQELANKTGSKSTEDLREKITNELEKYSKELSFNILKNHIIKVIEKDYDFPLPNSLVERELLIEKQNNEFEKKSKENQAKLLPNLKTLAEKKVKIGLVISEIGIQNKINVSDKELETEIAKICMQYPGREKEIIEHYKNNPSHMNSLKGPIFENKVINFFINNSDVKDVKVSSDELNDKVMKIEKELNKENKGK